MGGECLFLAGIHQQFYYMPVGVMQHSHFELSGNKSRLNYTKFWIDLVLPLLPKALEGLSSSIQNMCPSLTNSAVLACCQALLAPGHNSVSCLVTPTPPTPKLLLSIHLLSLQCWTTVEHYPALSLPAYKNSSVSSNVFALD